MPEAGAKAPDFKTVNHEEKEVRLSEFSGKYVVLYFYPKDDTPGCTKEAIGFRDFAAEFEKNNAVILGVSTDGIKSHQKFRDKYDLNFQLLSDESKDIVNKYGVWKEKNMYGKKYMGIERTTFVIDPQGVISKVYEKVKVQEHAEEVLGFIKKSG